MKTLIITTCKRYGVPLIACGMIFMFSSCNRYGGESSKNFFAANVDSIGSPTAESIVQSIDDELRIQDGVSNKDFQITAIKGIVTIEGVAQNILEKKRAVQIIKATRGVRGVIDNITVKATDITDQDLKVNVEQALKQDPATESYQIDVSVVNGAVKLKGTVDSWQERQLSTLVASQVAGVRSVENDIVFNYASQRPDQEIENEIKERLRWDIRVDDGLIQVRVIDGNVSLYGSVASAAEHSQATIDAWVAGVQSVDTKGLGVKDWVPKSDFRKDKYAERSDEEIQQAIVDALTYEPRVTHFEIQVSVDSGKAVLEGVVNNLKAKQVAEMDARNVVGVWTVENRLEVKDDHFPEQEIIRNEIQSALAWNPSLSSFDLRAEVSDGRVTLSGNVNSYWEKYLAGDAASSVAGVDSVHNQIIVNHHSYPFAYDYGYSAYHPYHNELPSDKSATLSDDEIAKGIARQFWWSPFVNSDEVHVEVKNGRATITGTVDTWREYYDAEKNAFEGGALAVDNNLRITKWIEII